MWLLVVVVGFFLFFFCFVFLIYYNKEFVNQGYKTERFLVDRNHKSNLCLSVLPLNGVAQATYVALLTNTVGIKCLHKVKQCMNFDPGLIDLDTDMFVISKTKEIQ